MTLIIEETQKLRHEGDQKIFYMMVKEKLKQIKCTIYIILFLIYFTSHKNFCMNVIVSVYTRSWNNMSKIKVV